MTHRKLMSGMTLLIGLMFVPHTVFAGFGFYGSVRQASERWNGSMYVWDTTDVWTQVGPGLLLKSSLTVNPCGSYLDIIEDGWVSGSFNQGFDPASLTGSSLMLDGTFQLPPKAALVGAVEWINDKSYYARLYPSMNLNQYPYSDTGNHVDSSAAPVMKIVQTADGIYRLSVYTMKFGESRHIRIRYLLANSGGGLPAYTVPVLLASDPWGSNPAYLDFRAYADNASNAMLLSLTSGKIPLNDSSINSVPFVSSVSVSMKNGKTAVLRLTSFNDSSWLGNYLMLNATIADSVIGLLSKKIETVFLWRWNDPSFFVNNYYDDYNKIWNHYLSSFGNDALNQAQAISTMVNLLSARGHRTGLVHSIEGDSIKTFPLAGTGSRDFISMQAYLETINQDYILSKYSWSQKAEPSDPRADSLDIVRKTSLSISEFIKSVKASVALYSDSAGVLHHLIVITAGPNTSSSQVLPYTTVDSLLGNVTYDATLAHWRGVSFGSSANSTTRQNLVPYFGYYFPSIEPALISLKFRNSAKVFSYLFNPLITNSFAITGKSSMPWDTILTWTGLDNTGNMTGSIDMIPSINRIPLDSGLVKLWAADKDRLAENVENNLGGTYGFVTEAYSMTATTRDTVAITGDGISYLSHKDIYGPSGVKLSLAPGRLSGSFFAHCVINRTLVLTFGPALQPATLRLFDLKGRLLGTINLRDRIRSGTIEVSLKGILPHGGMQSIIAVVDGANIHKEFAIVVH